MRAVLPIALLVVVALLVFVQMRPDRFHVERSTTINAASTAIVPHINDFHRWTAWSPFEKIDPQLQRSYDGPPSGVGAGYQWTGNNKIGEGSMKITESTPSKVGIDLEFVKPFKASNVATFTLAPAGSGTRVTWAMDGQNSFVSEAMGLFMSMDDMVGTEFEKGLASLKGIAEGAPGGL
jgi:hypothetical protein